MDDTSLRIKPIFDYIEERVEDRERVRPAGLYVVPENNATQTKQLLLNGHYIGAIQYEGSNNWKKKETNIVSLRFKRANISKELKRELELITSFRRDRNDGPAINPKAESIAFKFKELNDSTKETIQQIVAVLRKYT